MSSSRSDPLHGQAMLFVAKAKSTVTTETYNEFIRLLYNHLHARTIDIGVFKEGVFDLFKDHNDLLSRFNVFLPQGHKFSLPSDNGQHSNGDALAVRDVQNDNGHQGGDDAIAVKDEQKDDEHQGDGDALVVKDDEHRGGDDDALEVVKDEQKDDEHQGDGDALVVENDEHRGDDDALEVVKDEQKDDEGKQV